VSDLKIEDTFFGVAVAGWWLVVGAEWKQAGEEEGRRGRQKRKAEEEGRRGR
jgi:hypothetical protein